MRNSAHDTYHVSHDKTSIDLSHSHSKALSHSTCDGQMFQNPVEMRALSYQHSERGKDFECLGFGFGVFCFAWFGSVLVCFFTSKELLISVFYKSKPKIICKIK